MTAGRDGDRPEHGSDHEPPVIRDKRRVSPDGSVREPDPSAAPAPAAVAEPVAPDVPMVPMVPLDDLQRLKAEYDNYRRRTEKEKQAVGEMATAQVLGLLLPVLDDVERARAHGDLTGAFAAVGDALSTMATKLGLEQYGEAGDVFDPQVHDAVMTAPPIAGVDVTVVADAFRPGYRFAGRVLRPAQVAVAEPLAPDDAGGERTTDPAPEA